ncbi:MAG: glycosyltransferase [Bacteroidales bacterium]|nr:glycosyltransferase [Bacteroidales bacterium]
MKILVVLSRFPYPLEKGDKLRAYHQIRCLAKHHDIYLVALHEQPVSDSDMQQLKPFCKEIFLLQQNIGQRCYNLAKAFFTGLPLQCGYFYTTHNQHRLDEIVHEVQPDHIYCQLIRMAEYVMDYPIKKTLDYQDVFSKGMLRRYEKAPWFKKPFFKMEYRRLARYEAQIFNRFDSKTIITAVDRDLIPHENKGDITVVPNGVDFEHFRYRGEPKTYDLIFSGNMNYAPNIDAAEYLAKEIFPLLKTTFPNLRLVLSGATPAPSVKALANENIIVTGWVDSMAEWYAKSKIFIAPMRLGTGLQNKLLEAMSMQLPCITSHLAGKPLENAETQGAIITCSTTSGYVEAIRRLLEDEAYYEKLSIAGNQYVNHNYDWVAATLKLENILNQ